MKIRPVGAELFHADRQTDAPNKTETAHCLHFTATTGTNTTITRTSNAALVLLKINLFLSTPFRHVGKVEVQLYSFLTSELD
jgi:hypothetical protein